MAQFGVTTAMVSIVLSVFMAGLGLGSWASGRWLRQSDDTASFLALRVYARFGYVPIYVGQILAEPSPPVRIPGPRLLRSVPGG